MPPYTIRELGDPVLRTETDPVTTFDKDLRRLVDDMFTIMYEADGVGLAANQIGISRRIFVYDVNGRSGHVINPELSIDVDEQLVEDEGCLSLPGRRAPLARAAGATIRGLDRLGRPVDVRARGYLARCFQHEVDHLDGRVFVDHLPREVRRRLMITSGGT